MMSGAPLVASLEVDRPGGFHLRLDLTIEPRTTTALLGPNGAGKSTAVWALAGVVPLDRGRVAVGDRVLDDPEAGVFVPPEERRFGVVFQDVLLFPHLTVLQNVAFGLRAAGTPRRRALQRAADVLGDLGLSALAHERPGRLSGGQAQHVALARALAAEPDVLLLDEPLSAIDVGNRVALRRILVAHLDAFAGPRLLITHDPAEALLLADRVVILEDGIPTQAGTPEEILRHPQTPYVADLAGLNLLAGSADAGRVVLDDGPSLEIGDSTVGGRVLVTIHPRAISLHPSRPVGSPRNAWQTTVALVETLGDRTRVRFGPPLALTAEVTSASERELGLAPGVRIWVAVKAAEIGVQPG